MEESASGEEAILPFRSKLSLLKPDFKILWLIFTTPATSPYKLKCKSLSTAKSFPDSLPFAC